MPFQFLQGQIGKPVLTMIVAFQAVCEIQVQSIDGGGLGSHQGSFQDVTQLTDVTGPRMFLEPYQGALGEAYWHPPAISGKAIQKDLGEGWEVLGPLAQRGHGYLNGTDAIK